MNSQHVTVLLATYNEAAAIPVVLRQIGTARDVLRSAGSTLDVVLADDRSPDGTAEVAQRTADQLGVPLVVVPGIRAGLGRAQLRGFEYIVQRGSTDVVVTMDADGQHDGSQIPRLVEHLIDERLDVVIGSRWVRGARRPGQGAIRGLTSLLANQAFQHVVQVRGVRDATTTYRAARLPTIRDFDVSDLSVTGYSLQSSFVANAVAKGYAVGEFPIDHHLRIGGTSKLRFRDIVEYVLNLFILRNHVSALREKRLSRDGRDFSEEHFGFASGLERLSEADRFFDWILDEFEPHLGEHVLEVGAGIGTITRKLTERRTDLEVTALEPAGNLFVTLEGLAREHDRVEIHQETLESYRQRVGGTFDTVLYLNVLEHIEDDDREIKLVFEHLRPGGTFLVFVPALERLYSELDFASGHYRRYRVDDVRDLVTSNGFDVLDVRYFDMLGVFPYYLTYRLLHSTTIGGSSIAGYDRIVVPISRWLQRFVRRPPFGKNVILIARKRAGTP